LNDNTHVQIENLTIERGGQVLVSELSLGLPRGRFVAVVGPSGAGKSTLLETLGGLWSPRSGSVTYRCCRHCLHTPADFRSRIGFIFQQLHLARNATVLNNVLTGALPRHRWWRTLVGFPAVERNRAWRLLDALALSAYSRRLVRQLSGGQQQRVALARALLQEPELILADEPVSHLDALLAERVLTVLKEGICRSNRTVLCVLHDKHLVERFADAVLTLGGGSRPNGQWAFTGG
jgi:phosphonate transport system ATP-binding protein